MSIPDMSPPGPPGPGGLGISFGFDAAITSSMRSIMQAASVAALMTCSFTEAVHRCL